MAFRDEVIKSMGKFPEKVELNEEITGSTVKDGCTIQTVSYNVEKGERIKAFLLLPPTPDNNPAVLVSHQHGGEFYLGKSEPAGFSKNTANHVGLELCKRGYVVLCPDHLGFEDRRPAEYTRKENSHLDGGAYERYLFTSCILKGTTLQAKYLSDLCRGLDYLESLSFVDSKRIGAIGHSLGGQETLWLSWFDDRVKAGISSCGFSQLHTILSDGINHNFALYTYGFLNLGDMSDLVCDMAPKPFLMINGEADPIMPVRGVREIAQAAAERYKSCGRPESFQSLIFKGGHGFPDEMRLKAYDWLDGILKVKT